MSRIAGVGRRMVSKILVGFKAYTIKRNSEGTFDLSEDRRDCKWSDPLSELA